MSQTVRRAEPAAVRGAIALLRAKLGDKVVTSAEVRRQHANTTTWLPNEPADAVVYAASTEDVQEAVRIAAAHQVPVIPFGAGTSLEGHVNAPLGGICIDVSQMNEVLAVHSEDLDCVVQPGVTRKKLNEYLRDQGLFFPIDPGADASLGGMAATRASGTNAVRYGAMKDNVLSLQAVLPNGDIFRTATRARKSSAGYDLTRLLIGSEGTLSIITELTLKLSPIPEAISSAICPFQSIEGACQATIATIQVGIPVARIEFLDAMAIRATNNYSRLSLAETPTLFLEFHGSQAGVKEQVERVGEIAAEFGGGPFHWTSLAEERSKLWQARHDAHFAMLGLRPGAKVLSTDICVPISRLAEAVTETSRDVEDLRLLGPIVGHVGDGNFHVGLIMDLEDRDEVARVYKFLDRLVERALRLDGTCTGEHGVGQGKIKYMEAEHGATAINAMQALKRALDPNNIMNPGKIFPVDRDRR
jgi:D-lactate dehydrogenase (cytochrome)